MSMSEKEKGKFIRYQRKKKNLKMEDLADDNISTTTISKIELGQAGVSDDKKKYLCSKMNMDYHEIPTLIQEERKKISNTLIVLEYIEQTIDLGDPTKALKQLRTVELSTSYIKCIERFLRGRIQFVREDITEYEKAKSYFEEAINLLDQHNDFDKQNIRAASFNQLSQIFYSENKYQLAIEYIDKGLESFENKAERGQLNYSLLINKAVCLEKLDYLEQASIILKELWGHIDQITHIDVLINLYDVQANIYRKSGFYSQAIEQAQEGLKIARVNRKYNRVIELSLTLGSSYMSTNQLTEAYIALNSSIELEKFVEKRYKHLFVPIYTRLGKLLLLQNQPDRAQDILETALTGKIKTNDVIRYTEMLITLGDSLYDQGYVGEALKPYEKALELAQKHALLKQEDVAYYKLCSLWFDRDESKLHDLLTKKFLVEVRLKTER